MENPSVGLKVEALTGDQGLPEPSAFFLGARRVDVLEVMDRWLASDHGYVKLRTNDGIYILRHDQPIDCWALTLYKESEALPKMDVGPKPAVH